MFHIVYSSNLSHHDILFMALALAPIVWLIVGLQAASIFMSDTKYTSSGEGSAQRCRSLFKKNSTQQWMDLSNELPQNG